MQCFPRRGQTPGARPQRILARRQLDDVGFGEAEFTRQFGDGFSGLIGSDGADIGGVRLPGGHDKMACPWGVAFGALHLRLMRTRDARHHCNGIGGVFWFSNSLTVGEITEPEHLVSHL
jgi:hypothetical protein